MFEIAGCSLTLAREARVSFKLPFDADWLLVIKPSNFPLMKMSEIYDLSPTELSKKLRELGDELLHLQLRKQTGQVEKPI